MQKNLYSKKELKDVLKETLFILKRKEDKTDVKIADFIENNFKDIRLFYTPNHPVKYLMINVTNQILNMLQVNKTIIDNENINDCLNFFNCPVYPSVIKNLDLKFTSDSGSFGNLGFNNGGLEEYIKKYNENLYA